MTYRKGNLYFASDPGIYRLPVNDTGTVTTPVLISTRGGTSGSRKGIAANDEMLFWIFGTGINAVPLPNGMGGNRTSSSTAQTPQVSSRTAIRSTRSRME